MDIENNNIVPIQVAKYETEDIKNLIYCIRGKQVMLDSDVAMLYHYKTKVLNLTVRRNIERFPEEFCFQLTENELESLRFQIETSKDDVNVNKIRGGRRYLPYVFTEQGIAMLAGVLKSEIAIKMSINIIKAFVEMRKFIISNGQVFQEISNIKYKLLEHDKKFDEVFNELQKEQKSEFKQKIFFQGQIYDAYSLIIDDKDLYHCGASLKDLGKKCFAINKMEEINFLKSVEKTMEVC